MKKYTNLSAKKDQEGGDRTGSESDLTTIQIIVSLPRSERLLYMLSLSLIYRT